MAQRAFFLGFDCCGSDRIARIASPQLRLAALADRARIAEDILFSRLADQEPLKRVSDSDIFLDLLCTGLTDKPIVEAFREFKFLHEWFPDATFVLNTRSKAAWLAERRTFRKGRILSHYCRAFEMTTAEVVALWSASWETHHQEVRAHKWGDTPFFVLDMDTASDADIRDLLLQRAPAPTPWAPEAPTCKAPPKSRVSTARRLRAQEQAFADAVAEHCIGQRVSRVASGRPPELAFKLFAEWDGKACVTDCRGNSWPLQRTIHCGQDCFVSNPRVFKIARVQGVLNEILRLGRAGQVRSDMEDARRYGTEGVGQPSQPLLGYNRRPEAKNVVLWPLPGYHDIGDAAFAHASTPDTIPWPEKIDKVAWRGSLAGRTRAPNGRMNPSLDVLADLLDADPGSALEEELVAQLFTVNRFQFVSNFMLHSEFDVALTLPYNASAHKKIMGSPVALYFGARAPLSWIYAYKYTVCLAGADTGSNFFAIANSHSVVFKEEDGWQLFYTGSFRAWEHYIPIQSGGADLLDKLDWARSNPTACARMTERRLAVCAKFACASIRKSILNTLLDTLWQG